MKKLVFGVGINDADYIVRKQINKISIWCPYYVVWYGMLKRCYSAEALNKRKTYIGCKVCDKWLMFSKFKIWMMSQNWKNKDLDKDIFRPGNKMYSPETCVFVEPKINSLMLNPKSLRGPCVKGVSFHKALNKFVARVSDRGLCKNLGVFNTEKEACNAYLVAKSNILLREAECNTDKKVSKGLMRHAELLLKEVVLCI